MSLIAVVVGHCVVPHMFVLLFVAVGGGAVVVVVVVGCCCCCVWLSVVVDCYWSVSVAAGCC